MTTKIEGVTLYTIPEAAEKLGVSQNTIRAYIKSGKLKGHKVGRPIFITEKDIKRALKK